MASVAILNTLAIIASQLPNINPPTPIYSIFGSDDLIPLTIPSSWGEFAYKYDTQVSDYPVEPNGFAAYNKVNRPSRIYVQMVKTGSDIARFTWLAAIQQQESDDPTRLYTILCPDGVFLDYTLEGLSFEKRPDRGSNILRLELQFTQVPQIPSSSGDYTNVAEAPASAVREIGRVFNNALSSATTATANAFSFITG